MTPLAGAATATNLLLATGPFTYPHGFVNLGPVTASLMLAVTCFIAFITATFMIEAISVAAAVKHHQSEPENHDRDSAEFNSRRDSQVEPDDLKELHDMDSPFYIHKKIEITIVGETIINKTCKNAIIFILTIYVYGAVCLKYVGGAESFVDGVSHTIWGNSTGLSEALGFDSYYLGIMIFGGLSIWFSFGNIENAKTLQIVTTALRFIVTGMMICGSGFYLIKDGPSTLPVFDWKNQISWLAEVFGNTTFVFVYHHSISGIIYPVRPQKAVSRAFLWSHIAASLFLFTEALMAYFAFSGRDYPCVSDDKTQHTEFPCKVMPLYNENFLDLPFVGQICNFYPMLNVAAVPILNITLRNNLLDGLPIKKWVK
jgi:hypothetical protein